MFSDSALDSLTIEVVFVAPTGSWQDLPAHIVRHKFHHRADEIPSLFSVGGLFQTK